MAQDIIWTPHMDAQLHAMRARLLPVTVCAMKLGISRNAIINRLDRLGLATGARFRRQQQVKKASQQPPRPALTVIDNRNFSPSLPPLPSRRDTWILSPPEPGNRTVWLPPLPQPDNPAV
jgi:hypothetical protein